MTFRTAWFILVSMLFALLTAFTDDPHAIAWTVITGLLTLYSLLIDWVDG